MTCVRLGPALGHAVLCFQPDYKIMDRGGKIWWFEFHKYCGPSVLKKNGDPRRHQPHEKSPFWDAFEAWDRQGQRSEQRSDGTWAKWDHETVER
jgi:hypothetical protein